MFKNILILIGVIVVVAVVSAVITYFRAERLATPYEIMAKGLP